MFTVKHADLIRVITKPIHKMDGHNIRAVLNMNTVKYLGHSMCSAGILKANIIHYETWLHNLSKAPLKVQQKLVILTDHAMPKILY